MCAQQDTKDLENAVDRTGGSGQLWLSGPTLPLVPDYWLRLYRWLYPVTNSRSGAGQACLKREGLSASPQCLERLTNQTG